MGAVLRTDCYPATVASMSLRDLISLLVCHLTIASESDPSSRSINSVRSSPDQWLGGSTQVGWVVSRPLHMRIVHLSDHSSASQ